MPNLVPYKSGFKPADAKLDPTSKAYVPPNYPANYYSYGTQGEVLKKFDANNRVIEDYTTQQQIQSNKIPAELVDSIGVKAFQDWLDKNHPGWVPGRTLNKKVSKGYGNFGESTSKAWNNKQWREAYLTKITAPPVVIASFTPRAITPYTPPSSLTTLRINPALQNIQQTLSNNPILRSPSKPFSDTEIASFLLPPDAINALKNSTPPGNYQAEFNKIKNLIQDKVEKGLGIEEITRDIKKDIDEFKQKYGADIQNALYGNKNLASLLPTDIMGTINQLKGIRSFKDAGTTIASLGEQAIPIAIAGVVQGITESTEARLLREKVNLIIELEKLEINHTRTLLRLEQQNAPIKQYVNGVVVDIPSQLTDEEYIRAVEEENKNYTEAKIDLQKKLDDVNKKIDEWLKDPFKKQKDEIKKYKEKRKRLKNRTKEEKRKARKERNKKILRQAGRQLIILAPTIKLYITNELVKIVAQDKQLKSLIESTNATITEANISNDPVKLNNAKLARDNALKILQDNENKIQKVQTQINNILRYTTLFSTIVSVIVAIPIPTSVPPGIGIPVNLIMKFVRILDRANRIVLVLSAMVPSLLSLLDRIIETIRNYRAQLLTINNFLENTAVNGASGSALLLATEPIATSSDNQTIEYGSFPTEYRGFTFALREEKDPRLTVRGYKRRYAVAIDTNRVEVLKSESSFTLDPNDLIDQLKLIIDRENLIA